MFVYSDPSRMEESNALPNIEVFYVTSAGWYWWACFPGDGKPRMRKHEARWAITSRGASWESDVRPWPAF